MMKKNQKKKVAQKAKRVETIEEFLERGGEIQQCEAQESPETVTILKPTNTPHPHLMNIVDGRFFFAEKQKRKVDQNKKFLDKLSKSNLPQDVIDKLKGVVKTDDK
jgi:hypothetical protein